MIIITLTDDRIECEVNDVRYCIDSTCPAHKQLTRLNSCRDNHQFLMYEMIGYLCSSGQSGRLFQILYNDKIKMNGILTMKHLPEQYYNWCADEDAVSAPDDYDPDLDGYVYS